MSKFLRCKELYAIAITLMLWILFCIAFARADDGSGSDVGCREGDKFWPATCSGSIAVMTYFDNDNDGIYSKTVDGPRASSWFAYGIANVCNINDVYYTATLKTQSDGVFIFPESIGCMIFSSDGPISITSTHYVMVANVHVGRVAWVYLPYKSKLILEGAPSQNDPTRLGDEDEPVRVFSSRVYVTSILLQPNTSDAHLASP